MSLFVILPLLAAQVALSPAEAWDRIAPLNEKLQQASTDLPRRFGADAEKERGSVDAAGSVVASVRGDLEGLFSAGPAFERLQQNLAALEADVAMARLALDYVDAAAPVLAAHKAGRSADDAAYARLTETTTAFAAKPASGWADVASWMSARAERVGAKQTELVTLSSAAQMSPLFQEANRARRALDRALEDAPGRVAPELLQALGSAADAVSAVDPSAGRFYLAELSRYRIEDFWRIDAEAERSEAISEELGSSITTSGSARRRRLKASFSVEKGRCYSMLMRFAESGVGERITEFAMRSQPSATLLRYDQVLTGVGAQRTEGLCATADGRIDVSAVLERGSKTNQLRFVVVDWPRAEMPLVHAATLRLLQGDRCDDEGWYAHWATPVPGALVYLDGEPALLSRSEGVGKPNVSLLDVNGDLRAAEKGAIRSLSPEKISFKTGFRFSGCGAAESATTPDSKRLGECHRLVEKRFARQIERAERRLDRAAGDDVAAAQSALDVVRQQETAEREKRCLVIAKRIEGRMRRAYDRILDLYTEGAPAAVVDRAAELQAWERAKPDLR